MEDDDERGKVRALIDKATNSTAREVDPRLLRAIKSVVRYSDSELRLAAQTLLDLMKRDHSQVRYLTLLVIDELFMRSKLFRTIVVENFDQLLSLSVGFRRNLPLPAPPAIAVLLRSKAIEFLEKWNISFGIHYRQIRLGFDYLKNILKFQFPNLQANAARIQQERREREIRSKEIILNKFESLRTNLFAIKEEIQSTIDEIEECLDIVCLEEESIPADLLDDEDFEEFHSSELYQIRLDSLKEGKKVHEDSDNKVVFDALRELYKLLVTKHLVSIQEWISVLIRVEVADNRFRDSTLKEFIDIRNHLQSVKKQCEESGCYVPRTAKHDKEGKEEEDIWEEGKIGSVENEGTSIANKLAEAPVLTSTSGKVSDDTPECRNKSSDGNESIGREGRTDAHPFRNKLLAEAPVLKWNSSLDTWGSNRDVLANQRGLELESHWGRVDYDAVIPADKIAELSVQATLYEEEHVEIQPCRAPLSKRGLCQRRDLRVCPLHGTIVPRDDEGKPIHQKSMTDVGTSIDLGTNMVQQLAKQAVKTVRDRDNEEARKRKIDKQSLKRAKLAKIRGHNEAVLRDAAMASASISAAVGEDAVGNSVDRLPNRNKETLASMLRKKVTTKDRLAQRLLNARASNATIRQLTLGEDANYKEAFPNQW
ncbi:UV-stimulated scaffold protein A homolog [Tripterygium wilfordii]|nr:UV-stimulated scaffold protein A homolog [Tripterygium wilfordii]